MAHRNLPETTAIRLRTQLDCLPIILNGVPENALDRKPLPDKWSARENLAHLARYQEVFLQRIERMRTQDRPPMPRYRAEEDSEWANWAGKSIEAVLKRLRASRIQLIELVEQLPDSDLTRTGVHARFGELTIVQWLEFFLLHEAHHLLAVLQRARE
jgi:uncharacterized damage-inducible protein DinB